MHVIVKDHNIVTCTCHVSRSMTQELKLEHMRVVTNDVEAIPKAKTPYVWVVCMHACMG